ncbi:MAG: DUF2298 domain-containing protein [Anaerolineales bacterium]
MLLAIVLVAAAGVRLVGLNWDELQHLHPDERFLTMVVSNLRFPSSVGEYFNTDTSLLNPHNAGAGFFVYGTFPLILVRALGEWLGRSGYDEVHLIGRAAAAAFDLVTVLLVYLIGARLYRRSVGVLAASLAAFSPLLIQHAHFFVVDSFALTFTMAAFYFAVRAMDEPGWSNEIAFGAALGLAMASKISTVPVAGVLVLAGLARLAKMPAVDRQKELGRIALGLAAAAAVAFLAFRIAQPYAFRGPGFFGILPNPKWLANLAEIRGQSSGNVDLPFVLQWANRTPILFALKNLVVWGVGIPLGVAGWAGWAWAFSRLVRGQGPRHLLPVVWTGAHFLWQSTTFTPSMRYQLPIIPTLVLLAAWGLAEAWHKVRGWDGRKRAWGEFATTAAGVVVLGSTIAWALAFTSIYTRPVTRVAATRWMFTHVPGAVNLVVSADGGELLEPLPLPFDFPLSAEAPVTVTFDAPFAGPARAVVFPFVADLTPELGPRRIQVLLSMGGAQPQLLATAEVAAAFGTPGETHLEIPLPSTVEITPGVQYELTLFLDAGAIRLRTDPQILVSLPGGDQTFGVPVPRNRAILSSVEPITASVPAHENGPITSISFPYATALLSRDTASLVSFEVFTDPNSPVRATTTLEAPRDGEASVRAHFDQPLEVRVGELVTVRATLLEGSPLAFRGSTIISESSWDDGLPLRVDGRDLGGVYTGVVQELYWPDDQDANGNGTSDKLERLVSTLTQGDLLSITSNRQFGTIPRVPIRYPLTTEYYRLLLNCPAPQEVADCADRARPGLASQTLGYELEAVFRSDPTLGPWSISDQSAEELFTVYDHPLVLLFRKTPEFSEDRVRQQLAMVDLSHVVPVLPKEASSAPSDLLLPKDRRDAQRAGGTWSDLFSRNSVLFQSEAFGALAWWVLIFLIGLAAWPLTRAAFPGLRDGGYPISRLVGLLILAWGSWMLGSFRIAAHRPAILIVLAGVLAASAALAWKDRHEFSDLIRRHRREILLAEALALAFFLIDLGIRLGNPDLWHPSKGGEKPMDFSYLNAVLRAESFPPYDPWFAGGYINYYYFGFVIVGVPIQLLGMVPSVAYNLAIPTLFSLTALAAYCAARNLAAGGGPPASWLAQAGSKAAGIAGALGLVLLGNLATAKMIVEGWRRIGAEGAESGGLLPGLLQTGRGLFRFLTLQSPMPYAMDSWYWDPSRAIPPGAGEVGPITEFPFFTFIYADLHAHMIALPLTVLGLTWGISWLLAANDGQKIGTGRMILSLAMGGLIFGSLRPTNTWDFPVYLILGAAAAAAAPLIRDRVFHSRVLTQGLLAALGLAAAAVLLYLPYALWYGQGYTAADAWQGSRTDLESYFTVHGLFLFVILTWIGWEAIRWMAVTPMRALQRFRPWWGTLAAAGIIGLVAMIVLAVGGFQIALLAFPVVALAGILILRPGQPIGKRIVLALVATGVALTFVVDVFVLRGDISRMNTVFKFYLQVWTLFSVSAAAALVWMLSEIPAWKPGLRRAWVGGVSILVFCAALYPLISAPTKMRDRMEPTAPHSLDGMAFMDTAVYYDQGTSFPLAEDARAIRWLQENIQGTPVIVEAHIPEYRWGARMAIYTGLPTVLGWKHHQSQQRVVSGDPTTARAIEVSSFYLTASDEEARAFLSQYGVEYVVVGRLERMYYGNLEPCLPAPEGGRVVCDLANRLYGVMPVSLDPAQCAVMDANAAPPSYRCQSGGMEKFDRLAQAGVLIEVYRDGETEIYQVADP